MIANEAYNRLLERRKSLQHEDNTLKFSHVPKMFEMLSLSRFAMCLSVHTDIFLNIKRTRLPGGIAISILSSLWQLFVNVKGSIISLTLLWPLSWDENEFKLSVISQSYSQLWLYSEEEKVLHSPIHMSQKCHHPKIMESGYG